MRREKEARPVARHRARYTRAVREARRSAASLTALVLFAAAAPASAAVDDDALTFARGGKPVARLTKAELRARFPPTVRRFFDPDYGRTKAYDCLPLDKILDFAFGAGWRTSESTEVEFTALDGYVSFGSAAKLAEPGSCLAVADAESPGWEPVGRNRTDPGPFYLTWSGPEQDTEHGYPWPYQLAAIGLVRFEDRYPEVLPAGAKPGSAALRGYELFKANCVHCHSINRQGGKVGPDLNAPRSVTSYRAKELLKAYIRKPSDFRYTEMPDQAHLTDAQLEDLYQYLLFKKDQPEKPRRP